MRKKKALARGGTTGNPRASRTASKREVITAEHTPGPWVVQPTVGTWIQTAGDPYQHGQMHIADVRGWGHLIGQGACALAEDVAVAIQDANARLIAAAPELLAACKRALNEFSEWEGPEEEVDDAFDDTTAAHARNRARRAYAAIRAAVANAEGRS